MTALLYAAYSGLGLMGLGILLNLKSAAAPTRSRIAGALMIGGGLLSLGTAIGRQGWLCSSFEAELRSIDPSQIRAIFIRPAFPGASADPCRPNLFPSVIRISDRRVVSDILRELRGPSDRSRPPAKEWRCRLDVDLGDHELNFQVSGRPAGQRGVGTTISHEDPYLGTYSGCSSGRRDALGTLLEWIRDHP